MLAELRHNPGLKDILANGVEVDSSSNLCLRIASKSDRNLIINLINSVAGEHKYLQTDHYYSTPAWEQLLSNGINLDEGLLLLVVENKNEMVGFARLSPDLKHPLGRKVGNIGIALVPTHRSRGFGAKILNKLIDYAIYLNYLALTADILETNIRSKRLFIRCGFSAVSHHRIYLRFLNNYVNELCYEVELAGIREEKDYELSD
jgi:RimJ/RimL family protein N-acetyltransferase